MRSRRSGARVAMTGRRQGRVRLRATPAPRSPGPRTAAPIRGRGHRARRARSGGRAPRRSASSTRARRRARSPRRPRRSRPRRSRRSRRCSAASARARAERMPWVHVVAPLRPRVPPVAARASACSVGRWLPGLGLRVGVLVDFARGVGGGVLGAAQQHERDRRSPRSRRSRSSTRRSRPTSATRPRTGWKTTPPPEPISESNESTVARCLDGIMSLR